jgi:hypothetical protein
VNRLTALAALILVALAGAALPARADPASSTAPPPVKASSFAPHHTGKRAYGTPIEPQILHLHKRKPVTHRSAPPATESPSHSAAPQP